MMVDKILTLLSDTKEKFALKLSKYSTMMKLYSSPSARNVQNFILVWLDANIDEKYSSDCCNTMTQLRQIVNVVNKFTDVDQGIDFITNVKEEKVFLIISGTLGEMLISLIHDIFQIDSIYIFCQNEAKHLQWSRDWVKIKGVFTQIPPICDQLKQAARQCDQNAVSISLVSANEVTSHHDLHQTNQSFMYTQILKEILLTIEFKQQSMKDFLVYCRKLFDGNAIELEKITQFEHKYREHTPIWWYTYDCFLYSMLNRALRTMEIDTIIKMGFFIRDLHEHIQVLHTEQYASRTRSKPFTVYRGQGLPRQDFEKLLITTGGLLSFNNFLSTSKERRVGEDFARKSIRSSDLIGVLFAITIDPSSTSTPFASVKGVSCYPIEREILLSMHSVFRIGTIKRIDHNNLSLWQVELILTSDDDPQRRDLTERIRKETPGLTGWHRLGQFLIMIGQFVKAEDLYYVLLDQTSDAGERAHFNHHLGVIKDGQGDNEMAIRFYEISLEINTEILSSNHHYLASSYSGLGLVYSKKGEYAQALLAHRKALEIFQKTLSENNPHIAISLGNIGKVYDHIGEYSTALSSHKQALEIFENTFPPPLLYMAICYFDMGNVYDKLHDFSRALSSYKKTLDIREKILPGNHHLLAASCNSIGEVYVKIGEYTRARPFIQRAIDLGQLSLPANHPDLKHYRGNLLLFQTTF